MVGARVPAEIEENVVAAQVSFSDDDVARIEDLMSDVAGRVDVFRPFSSAMEVWT
jgi:aryl-alcohol dehydrogenase-like predicted oxidoreductase